MGYPRRLSVTPTSDPATSLTHTILLPSPVGGQGLVMIYQTSGGAVVDLPSGWAAKGNASGDAAASITYIFAKAATGGEGASVQVSQSIAQPASAQVYCFDNWSGDVADIEAIVINHVGTNAPNPPALNPVRWSAEDTAWIAFCARFVKRTIISFPANYTNGTDTTGGTRWIASAWREFNGETEDPGPFSLAINDAGTVGTIAIRPVVYAFTEGVEPLKVDKALLVADAPSVVDLLSTAHDSQQVAAATDDDTVVAPKVV